jgi:hypothetical protein
MKHQKGFLLDNISNIPKPNMQSLDIYHDEQFVQDFSSEYQYGGSPSGGIF